MVDRLDALRSITRLQSAVLNSMLATQSELDNLAQSIDNLTNQIWSKCEEESA